MSGDAIEATLANTLQKPNEVAANITGNMLVWAINKVQKAAEIPNLAPITSPRNKFPS